MAAAPADDPMMRLLADDLYGLLTREHLIEGANLLLTTQDDRLVIQIMASHRDARRVTGQPLRLRRAGRLRQPHPPDYSR